MSHASQAFIKVVTARLFPRAQRARAHPALLLPRAGARERENTRHTRAAQQRAASTREWRYWPVINRCRHAGATRALALAAPQRTHACRRHARAMLITSRARASANRNGIYTSVRAHVAALLLFSHVAKRSVSVAAPRGAGALAQTCVMNRLRVQRMFNVSGANVACARARLFWRARATRKPATAAYETRQQTNNAATTRVNATKRPLKHNAECHQRQYVRNARALQGAHSARRARLRMRA